MKWHEHARRLAADVTPQGSRWREVVATTPRHLFVPRWWDTPAGADYGHWEMRDGPSEETAWMATAYRDTSLVTQVDGMHADHAALGVRRTGRPTSSSTLPSLVVRLLRQHGEVYSGADVLDVATGSGYSAALLARLLGDQHVTSIDVDPYLVEAARRRLDTIGLHPQVLTCDATGPLPGKYDRIISMVAVRPIPQSWLSALKPGGRLVTTITGTSLIVVADKVADGGAEGYIARDWAMFMPTRSGSAYPPRLDALMDKIGNRDGEQVSRGRYPVVNVGAAWELCSMLEIMAPGIEHHYRETPAEQRIAWMLHADGSWARAHAQGTQPATVHQGGPRRLWDILDEIRTQWLATGALPLYGARASVLPNGAVGITRAGWKTLIQ